MKDTLSNRNSNYAFVQMLSLALTKFDLIKFDQILIFNIDVSLILIYQILQSCL